MYETVPFCIYWLRNRERSQKVRNIAFSDQIDVRKNLSTSFLTSLLVMDEGTDEQIYIKVCVEMFEG